MALAIHHLTPKDFKTMPWKNGGGSTTELAIWPPDASVSGSFDWRISLADLDGSGPFSKFPDFDRFIAQISGEPMILRHEGQREKLLHRYEPYAFPGDWETTCVLHGKAQDLNLMTRRGKVTGALEELLFQAEPVRRVHTSGTSFIWVAFGSVLVHESSKGHDHRLDRHHALDVTGAVESVLTIKAREEDTVAFLLSCLPSS